jgi:hypothetical protein
MVNNGCSMDGINETLHIYFDITPENSCPRSNCQTLVRERAAPSFLSILAEAVACRCENRVERQQGLRRGTLCGVNNRESLCCHVDVFACCLVSLH